jgi:selenocysteine lyase/cysteine desulfurase
MAISRRKVVQGFGALSILGAGGQAKARSETLRNADIAREPAPCLPVKAEFPFEGTHLNAAFAHPLGIQSQQVAERFLRERVQNIGKIWPIDNPREEAVGRFASLIRARPSDIAVVSSTLEGENLIAAALGLGPGRGVVTDPFHYDASLVMYGERHKLGMPLTVVLPTNHEIDYNRLEDAITQETKLVAVSWVSSWTGLTHDLKRVCEIAHKKGALVYADIIQGVGALPFDVNESNVDFCCSGTYKWLMGDFGTAFLYASPQSAQYLQRVQVGWRQLKSYTSHFLPFDSPGRVAGEWELGSDVAATFEVGTPNWLGLATVASSLAYIESLGVERIARHRQPLLRRLQEELPRHGFEALTPKGSHGPSVAFGYEGIRDRVGKRLEENQIFVTCGKNRIRISASVYNDMEDIDKLLAVLRSF